MTVERWQRVPSKLASLRDDELLAAETVCDGCWSSFISWWWATSNLLSRPRTVSSRQQKQTHSSTLLQVLKTQTHRYSRLKHTARHYGRYSRLKGHTIIRAILLAHSSIVEDISSCLSVTQWISTACTLSYLQKNSRTLQDQTHFPRISRSWKIHKKLVPYGDWRSTSARAY